jgi:transcriptional regulator with XRE-family HTH domain
MKQTPEDRRFAERFAQALQPHIHREQDEGKKTLREIAAKLGVTAAGLQKQLDGGTPSIRTVALAYAAYGVAVDYDGIDVARIAGAKGRRKKSRVSESQLFLPFEITAGPPSKRLTLKMIPKGVRRYRLQITVGMAG